jgi:hypothetical protein
MPDESMLNEWWSSGSGLRDGRSGRTDVRRSVLRQLGTSTTIEWTLAANPDTRLIDDPAQEMFEAYLRRVAPAIDRRAHSR